VRGIAIVALWGVLLVGCVGEDDSDVSGAEFVVGLVFDVGGRGDKSFNDAAYRGLQWARDSLGVAFEIYEPTEGSDREAGLRLLATGDARIIFGVGFLFSDDVRAIAEEFPDKHFVCVDYSLRDGEILPDNLLAVRFREEQGSFLVGALAALTSNTGKIGFIGGMDIPLIHRFQVGYEAGARHAREDVERLVSYAGVTGDAFKNPGRGKELAMAQYENGADIIFHASGATGLGVFQAARRLRRLAIGVDSDQWDEAPGQVLTSMIKRVDVAVYAAIRSESKASFQGGVVELGLNELGVDYVYDEHNQPLIDADHRETVENIRAAIIGGEIVVPRELPR